MNTNPHKLMQFNLLAENAEVLNMYKKHEHFHPGDCGLDLFCPDDVTIRGGSTKLVDLRIKCSADLVIEYDVGYQNWAKGLTSEYEETITTEYYPTSYDIRARSSISKTPLRLANSVGTIDAGYRGNLMLALDNIKVDDYTIKKGTRLVQIVSPFLGPINLNLVSALDETIRGSGGFGSTGL